MIEVKEIKLSLRYPDSKQEDITDAFMRGYTNAVDATKKAIERLEKDNDKLRELVVELYEDQCDECDRWKYRDCMQELGIEVPE